MFMCPVARCYGIQLGEPYAAALTKTRWNSMFFFFFCDTGAAAAAGRSTLSLILLAEQTQGGLSGSAFHSQPKVRSEGVNEG